MAHASKLGLRLKRRQCDGVNIDRRPALSRAGRRVPVMRRNGVSRAKRWGMRSRSTSGAIWSSRRATRCCGPLGRIPRHRRFRTSRLRRCEDAGGNEMFRARLLHIERSDRIPMRTNRRNRLLARRSAELRFETSVPSRKRLRLRMVIRTEDARSLRSSWTSAWFLRTTVKCRRRMSTDHSRANSRLGPEAMPTCDQCNAICKNHLHAWGIRGGSRRGIAPRCQAAHS